MNRQSITCNPPNERHAVSLPIISTVSLAAPFVQGIGVSKSSSPAKKKRHLDQNDSNTATKKKKKKKKKNRNNNVSNASKFDGDSTDDR